VKDAKRLARHSGWGKDRVSHGDGLSEKGLAPSPFGELGVPSPNPLVIAQFV
jgi:hypothetical protein